MLFRIGGFMNEISFLEIKNFDIYIKDKFATDPLLQLVLCFE